MEVKGFPRSKVETLQKNKRILIGNRIPKDFFITSGSGESDVTIHAGSYHLALKDAGIEKCNILVYSSILPSIANRIEKPEEFVHGSVMETIMACSNSTKGRLATAGLIFGWLFDRETGEKYGGLVCEYSGHKPKEEAMVILKKSLIELYKGFSERYELRNVEVTLRGFVPEKKFGTAVVALCFVNYEYPIIEN